ncbi:MAG: Hsp20/alpha crystallin family protein [Gemmatimonadota bacterium]|nr:Hsp20/alpha crystallin family protein [Gemmatimonadota bacterium]MDE3126845.1 Hsp20/alpha crystallin family protein [Gemmatimonadota bacterium]MDE3171794.1 Hsp20/alpha crystallin family protein [Gemmatimonadota bacterium]MDE3215238.1 Hsp20/alpha crystallin family protein [Gemmatimonadota bacterium]
MLTTRSLSSTLDRMLSLNQAFDDAFFSGAHDGAARVWVPALDVAERKDAYLITLDLPGVDPKDVDLSFEQNVLTIRGTKPSTLVASPDEGEMRVYANERVSGTFERSVRLPEFVDGDRIAAHATHGVLEITVPKAQAAQPRKIEIRHTQPQVSA